MGSPLRPTLWFNFYFLMWVLSSRTFFVVVYEYLPWRFRSAKPVGWMEGGENPRDLLGVVESVRGQPGPGHGHHQVRAAIVSTHGAADTGQRELRAVHDAEAEKQSSTAVLGRNMGRHAVTSCLRPYSSYPVRPGDGRRTVTCSRYSGVFLFFVEDCQ